MTMQGSSIVAESAQVREDPEQQDQKPKPSSSNGERVTTAVSGMVSADDDLLMLLEHGCPQSNSLTLKEDFVRRLDKLDATKPHEDSFSSQKSDVSDGLFLGHDPARLNNKAGFAHHISAKDGAAKQHGGLLETCSLGGSPKRREGTTGATSSLLDMLESNKHERESKTTRSLDEFSRHIEAVDGGKRRGSRSRKELSASMPPPRTLNLYAHLDDDDDEDEEDNVNKLGAGSSGGDGDLLESCSVGGKPKRRGTTESESSRRMLELLDSNKHDGESATTRSLAEFSRHLEAVDGAKSQTRSENKLRASLPPRTQPLYAGLEDLLGDDDDDDQDEDMGKRHRHEEKGRKVVKKRPERSSFSGRFPVGRDASKEDFAHRLGQMEGRMIKSQSKKPQRPTQVAIIENISLVSATRCANE